MKFGDMMIFLPVASLDIEELHIVPADLEGNLARALLGTDGLFILGLAATCSNAEQSEVADSTTSLGLLKAEFFPGILLFLIDGEGSASSTGGWTKVEVTVPSIHGLTIAVADCVQWLVEAG